MTQTILFFLQWPGCDLTSFIRNPRPDPFFVATATKAMALVDNVTAHPWVDLLVGQPRPCVELSGQADSFSVSGEFIMSLDRVSTTILHGECNNFTLHSPLVAFSE
jgi:hypothetical protein